MGTWGTGISSNDTFAEIYDDFFILYNEGLEVPEITEKLIHENQGTIDLPEDANEFWFALAKAQWECKALDPVVLQKVKLIIETGSDLEVWRQLEADHKTLKKRKEVLEKFLATLLSEKAKAKKRKKIVIRQAVFEKGDCLTFKLENGNYGGAVVLEAINDSEFNYNLIANTNLNCPEKPVQKDFESANVLIMNYGSYSNKAAIQWYYPIRHKKTEHLIEKICSLKVEYDYKIGEHKYGFASDFDIWFIEVANSMLIEKKNELFKDPKLTIRSLTKKGFWDFW
jgi:hypothetical protein